MLIPVAQAAGVIDDAPTFAHILLNAFYFLLQITGMVVLIGVVVAGMLYFFANGDRKQIANAKKITTSCVVGFVVMLGAWVLVKTIGSFFTP